MKLIFQKIQEGASTILRISIKSWKWLFIRMRVVKRSFRLLNRTEKYVVYLLLLFSVSGFYIIGRTNLFKVTVPGPAYGGNYTEVIVGEVTNLNPLFYQNETELEISNLMYSSLIDVKANTIENDLIKSLNIEQEQNYDLVLNDNIYWHDGKELTIEDIEFTVNILQSPLYNGPLKGILNGVVLEVLSDTELRFSLPTKDKNFARNLSFPIIPKHIFENIPLTNMGKGIDKDQMIGSGPYKISEINRKDQKIEVINFDAFRKYHADRPYISKLNIKIADIEGEGIERFAETNNRGMYVTNQKILEDNDVKNHYNKFELFEQKELIVFFNSQINPFDNKELRSIFSEAVNKEAILNELGEENGRLISGPILPGHYAYKDIDVSKYDFAKSKEQFDNLKLDLKELTIITDGGDNNKKVAEELRKSWGEFGIKINIRNLNNDDIQQVIHSKEYSVLILGISMDTDNDPYPYWHSSQIENGGLNLSKFDNQEADSLLEKLISSANPDNSKQYLFEFQDIIAKEVPAIFLFQPKSYYLIDINIKVDEEYFSTKLDRFDKINLWYIKTKRVPK
ncbi:MAG: ABC transporter substrate-binding protein [bacterium]